jgi:hypothetical protein
MNKRESVVKMHPSNTLIRAMKDFLPLRIRYGILTILKDAAEALEELRGKFLLEPLFIAYIGNATIPIEKSVWEFCKSNFGKPETMICFCIDKSRMLTSNVL